MIIFYSLLLFFLGIYSYSQIDLNLTLFQASWFLAFQKWIIYLGYFNRPISTAIFIVIIVLLFVFYLLFFWHRNKISRRDLAILLGALAVLGLVSYPAFSHDLFNSIFYPRLIFEHGANPYNATALMYPADPWTRFMHWTHNTYPWGPVYLGLSIPFYLLGFGKFVLTLINFKLLHVLAYLGSAYFIFRLAGTGGAIFFALNPLIILEAVVSGHLDIVMLVFSLASVYFVRKNIILSFLLMILSVGVKFVTALFLPVLLWWTRFSEDMRMKALLFLSFLGVAMQIYFRDLLPHYFIVPLGVAALFPRQKYLFTFSLLISLVLLLVRYLPFLYSGQWLSIKPF